MCKIKGVVIFVAITIAISNQKGGVGKTATTSALAYGLKRRGYSILVIDGDGQCNTTDAFQASIEGAVTLYDVMQGEATAQDAIQKTIYMDIIAGDYLLKQADKTFDAIGREHILEEKLKVVQNDYDFVVIDTPPALGVMLANSLVVADYIIIPMGADRDSLQGLAQLSKVIDDVHKYSNPGLKVLGLLITRANKRANLVKDIHDILPTAETALNTKTFHSIIRENVHVQDARALFMPIIEYKKQSGKDVIAVEDYDSLIDEVLYNLKIEGAH